MIDHFFVSEGHIEIESIGNLTLDVAEKGLTVTGCPDYIAHCVSPKEGMELGHSTVQRLGRCPAIQFNLHFFRHLCTGMFDESLEPLSLESRVLH